MVDTRHVQVKFSTYSVWDCSLRYFVSAIIFIVLNIGLDEQYIVDLSFLSFWRIEAGY